MNISKKVALGFVVVILVVLISKTNAIEIPEKIKMRISELQFVSETNYKIELDIVSVPSEILHSLFFGGKFAVDMYVYDSDPFAPKNEIEIIRFAIQHNKMALYPPNSWTRPISANFKLGENLALRYKWVNPTDKKEHHIVWCQSIPKTLNSAHSVVGHGKNPLDFVTEIDINPSIGVPNSTLDFTAKIEGEITDNDNKPLEGLYVHIDLENNKTVQTDKDGKFTFTEVKTDFPKITVYTKRKALDSIVTLKIFGPFNIGANPTKKVEIKINFDPDAPIKKTWQSKSYHNNIQITNIFIINNLMQIEYLYNHQNTNPIFLNIFTPNGKLLLEKLFKPKFQKNQSILVKLHKNFVPTGFYYLTLTTNKVTTSRSIYLLR